MDHFLAICLCVHLSHCLRKSPAAGETSIPWNSVVCFFFAFNTGPIVFQLHNSGKLYLPCVWLSKPVISDSLQVNDYLKQRCRAFVCNTENKHPCNRAGKCLIIFTSSDGKSEKNFIVKFENFTCPARRSTGYNKWTSGIFQQRFEPTTLSLAVWGFASRATSSTSVLG